MHTQPKSKERKKTMLSATYFVRTFFNNSSCNFGDTSIVTVKLMIAKFWKEVGYQRILIGESNIRQIFQNMSVQACCVDCQIISQKTDKFSFCTLRHFLAPEDLICLCPGPWGKFSHIHLSHMTLNSLITPWSTLFPSIKMF